jgi:hypothetical protein
VVANYGRIELFWQGLAEVRGFDFQRDRIIVLDCSETSQETASLRAAAATGVAPMLAPSNYVFIRRLNWNLNHGAQLDYFYLLDRGVMSTPRYTFFVQDHYLNRHREVKGDSIPEDFYWDLNFVFAKLQSEPTLVCFAARNGFRISTVVRSKKTRQALVHQSELAIVIDGGNFVVNPKYYLDYFSRHPSRALAGTGSYGFAHVWETRLCWILGEAGCQFMNLRSGLAVSDVRDLKEREPEPGQVWQPFLNSPIHWTLYGRDIYKYPWATIFSDIGGLLAEVKEWFGSRGVNRKRRTLLDSITVD